MWGEVFYFCPHHFRVVQLCARTIRHYMLRSMFWLGNSLFLCLLVFLGGIAAFDSWRCSEARNLSTFLYLLPGNSGSSIFMCILGLSASQ
jgi:hypothetical protein